MEQNIYSNVSFIGHIPNNSNIENANLDELMELKDIVDFKLQSLKSKINAADVKNKMLFNLHILNSQRINETFNI